MKIFNLKTIIILSLGTLMLASCLKVLDKFQTFTFSKTSSFSIPATVSLGLPFAIQTPDIESNLEQELQGVNSAVNYIEYVKLSGLNLNITSPANGNFNFLKSISIHILADGQSELLIAEKLNMANENLSSLDLNVQDVDLKPYLIGTKFKLKVTVETDEIISQEYFIDSKMTFEVKTKII